MAPDGSDVSQPARGSSAGIGVVVRLSWLSNRPIAVLRLTYSPRGPAVTPNGAEPAAIGNAVTDRWSSTARCPRVPRWRRRDGGGERERDEQPMRGSPRV